MYTEETVAVIVSYNPDIEVFQQLLTSLESQCPAIIIDNGSNPDSLQNIQAAVKRHGNATLINSGENLGIAHAQNTAIKHILGHKSSVRFALMLDHDSIPEDGMVTSLIKTYDYLTGENNRVAAVGPVLYDPRHKSLLKFHKQKLFYWGKIRPENINSGNPAVEVDNLNSSGTLISIEAYRNTGGFDEELFIDHVETDWCFRAKAAGYKLYATTDSRLTHTMGDDICTYWLFGRKVMPYRSPARHYYLVRNSILLQKRGYIPLGWKFSCLLKLGFTYFYFGWYHSDRAMQRRQIHRGIIDGFKGITGKSAQQPQEQAP